MKHAHWEFTDNMNPKELGTYFVKKRYALEPGSDDTHTLVKTVAYWNGSKWDLGDIVAWLADVPDETYTGDDEIEKVVEISENEAVALVDYFDRYFVGDICAEQNNVLRERTSRGGESVDLSWIWHLLQIYKKCGGVDA